MKSNKKALLAAVTSIGLFSAMPAFAEEASPDEAVAKLKEIESIIGASGQAPEEILKKLEAAGVEVKAPADQLDAKIKQMQSIMGAGDQSPADMLNKLMASGVNVGKRQKIFITDPDGKLHVIEGDIMRLADPDKDQIEMKLPKELGEMKVHGQVTVIGPDGEVKTKDLTFGKEGFDLEAILKEAGMGVDVGSVKKGSGNVDIQLGGGIFSVGPAVLMDPAKDKDDAAADESTKKQIEELRAELAEQRKMLEKIIEKLN